nr:TPA_asm: ND5 [Echinogammarus berilloni]
MAKSGIYSVFSASLFLSGLGMYYLGLLAVFSHNSTIVEWEAWESCSVSISMSLLLDWMSLVFLGSVGVISGCIMKYSEYYMEGEKNSMRFVLILFLFVVSMGLLIISPNMVSLLLGWDGLGLTSYVLVIFYQSETANNSGMLTVLSNRIGDVAILLSIALMFSMGEWGFYGLEESSWGLAALVILASVTKSAQMPFSAWLPAAMAAPTPVSALVHSSTLVTAGVYLLIRFSSVINQSGLGPALVTVAVMTMVMAGAGAMFESDMKKVVALSTLSQLGLMVMVVGAGMSELAFFHLITHAMFKSSLFMCAGLIIHSSGGSQDSRVMSGFSVGAPFLGLALSSTNLALCGFPFLAGFYSKDSSLEYVLMSGWGGWVESMVIMGTGLTVAYSLRVLFISSGSVWVGGPVSGLSDASLLVVKSMGILLGLTVMGGFFLYWSVIPSSLPWVLSGLEKLYVPMVSVLGGLVSYSAVLWVSSAVSGSKSVEGLLSSMWFLPLLSTKYNSLSAMKSSLAYTKLAGAGWMEYYGPQGVSGAFLESSSIFQKGQHSVMVSGYLITMVFSVSLMLFLC